MMPELVSGLIFLIALILILAEKLDRTIVAAAGAVVMVAVGTSMGFYDEHLAIASIDFETLGLLFGMMTLVSLMKPTGAFEYLAARAAKLSKGNPFALLILLGTITTLLSMVLDNVTTVVLIAPVTVLITEILGISPVPFLISEAVLSNTGGVATLIGDPPNVIISGAAGLTFNDFLIHSLPVVLVAWSVALGAILWLFRHQLRVRAKDPKALEGLRPEQTLHDRKTALKLSIVLGIAILLFFLQAILGLSSSFIAISMMGVALVWLRPDMDELFERLEWPVLIFFGGLFVMVGGLQASGALMILEKAVMAISHGNTLSTALLIIWIAAFSSALVDNIPITVAFIPIILDLGVMGMDIFPLWWALAFGAGFGGSGTIIGSTANVVVVQISRRTREPITSLVWLRRGLPVMLITCTIASLAFIVAFGLFTE